MTVTQYSNDEDTEQPYLPFLVTPTRSRPQLRLPTGLFCNLVSKYTLYCDHFKKAISKMY